MNIHPSHALCFTEAQRAYLADVPDDDSWCITLGQVAIVLHSEHEPICVLPDGSTETFRHDSYTCWLQRKLSRS